MALGGIEPAKEPSDPKEHQRTHQYPDERGHRVEGANYSTPRRFFHCACHPLKLGDADASLGRLLIMSLDIHPHPRRRLSLRGQE